MKKIIRMIVFSGLSLYLTAIWNKGFLLTSDLKKFFIASLIVACLYYFVTPLLRLIFFPINVLTVGSFSFFLYFVLFNYFVEKFSLVKITEWLFPGIDLGLLIIPKMHIGILANKALSAFSVAFIISLLELLI